MPKVRMLQAVSGSEFSWSPEEVVEMTDAEAAKWADGYRGELVDSPTKPKTPKPPTPSTPEAPVTPETPEAVPAPETPEAPKPARKRAARKPAAKG